MEEKGLSIKDKDTFLDDLSSWYNKVKYTYLEGSFTNLKEDNIRNILLSRIIDITPEDQKILYNFNHKNDGKIKTPFVYTTSKKEDIDYYQTFKKYETQNGIFKPIKNFLEKSNNQRIRHIDTINLLAFLLDYQPRPYSKYLKIETNSIDDITTSEEKTHTADYYIQALQNKYIKHSEFNSIRINGDVDNNIGLLPMKNYYIQLSYISQTDIYNRNSLLKSEIEQSYSKVKNSYASLSVTAHSQDYITEKVLTNDRIVISGNPGVGKSTYAKWLCYYWASHKERQDKTLVYIKLREVQFEQKNFLFDYIQNNYFDDIELHTNKLTGLLNKLGNYQLILDGFDEIDLQNRKVLAQKIQNLNYLVLSRPYGLIDHQLSYDVSFQIDGFNAESLTNYLDVLIDKKKQPNRSKEELLILIENNRVLHDFSHNPLMLSYIVLIYLTSDSYKTDLSSIESIYDLQAKVFDWILHYATQKPKNKIDFSNNMKKKMQAFAFELQINKEFTYKYDTNDKYFDTITNLYAIGLGSFNKLGKHEFNQWQFSFNTITFQEFLAAQYLENSSFSKDSFVYLLTDSFFWNYAVMLVGMLSKNKETSALLLEVLDFLYTFSKKETASYYRYSYYLLLAECNHYVVTKEVEKRSIAASINYYKKAYFDNFWESVMLDSLVKIVYKIPYTLKNEYIDYLLKEIAYSPSFDIEKSYYLSNLMDIGIEYNEKEILFALKDLIEELVKDLNRIEKKTLKIEDENHLEESEEYDDWMNRLDVMYEKENALRNALINLFNDFSLFSAHALTEIKDFILKVYKKEATFIRTLEYILAKTQLKIYDKEHFNHYLDYLIKHCKNTSTIENENQQIRCFENALLLAENTFISLKSTNSYYQFDSSLLLKSAKYLAKNLLDFSKFDSINDFYISHLIDLSISNLILLNKPKLYNLLFDLVYEFDTDVFNSIPNKKAIYSFIVDEIDQAINKQDLLAIEKILTNIKQGVFRAFDFYRYRELLLKTFNALLFIKNGKQIANSQKERINGLLIKIANIPYNNFDKKYFIDQLIKDKFSLTSFVKQEIILRRLAKNLMFYEKTYWQLFISFLKSMNWDVRSVVRLLSNKNLYLFETNHDYLFEIFIKTFENKKNTTDKIYTEFGSEILFLITQILLIIKKKPDDKLKYKTIHLIGQLIRHPSILNYYKFRITDLSAIEQITAYILYYSLNPSDEQLFFKENLYQEVSNEVGVKMAIIDYILSFMENSDYGIEIHEIQKLKPILGEKFYKELIDVMNQRLLNKNRFDSNHFKLLLESNI